MKSLYQAPSPDAPGLPPPPGHESHFQDAYTLQPIYAITVSLCIIVTTSLVAARLYTKARIIKKLTWEDLTCIIGYVTYLVFMSLYMSISNHGGGTHQWNVPWTSVQYYLRYSENVEFGLPQH